MTSLSFSPSLFPQIPLCLMPVIRPRQLYRQNRSWIFKQDSLKLQHPSSYGVCPTGVLGVYKVSIRTRTGLQITLTIHAIAILWYDAPSILVRFLTLCGIRKRGLQTLARQVTSAILLLMLASSTASVIINLQWNIIHLNILGPNPPDRLDGAQQMIVCDVCLAWLIGANVRSP